VQDSALLWLTTPSEWKKTPQKQQAKNKNGIENIFSLVSGGRFWPAK
jgi:hypothetical protein